jgi:hypothetical protein
MRKIRFKPVAAIAAALAPLMAAAGVINYTATYDYSKLTLGTDTLGGVTYTTVSYDGLYNGGDPGMPSLPVDYLQFSVPYNATDFTVSAVIQTSITQNTSYLIYPCQRSDWSIGGTVPVTLPDSSFYYSGSAFPSQFAHVVNDGFMAGENRIVTVAVMPVVFQHTSSNNMVIASTQITVNLYYEQRVSHNTAPLVRNDTSLRKEGHEITKSMVVNPGDVEANAPLTCNNNLNVMYPDDDITEPYSYIIVTTPEYLHSMRKIAALKRQEGFSVKLTTLQDAITQSYAVVGDRIPLLDDEYYQGSTDDAGKLRQFIRHHFLHHGTEYVLLAGADIPHRDYLGGCTDMYYSDLGSTWDYQAGTYPDVYVGRLLSKTEEHIENYKDKLFRYVLNPGNGNYSYLRKGLFFEAPCYTTELGPLSTVLPEVTHADVETLGHHISGSELMDMLNNTRYVLLATFADGNTSYFTLNEENDSTQAHYIWAQDSVRDSSVGDVETDNAIDCLTNKKFPMVFYSCFGKTITYHDNSPCNVDKSLGGIFTMGNNIGGPVFLGMTHGLNNPSSSHYYLSSFKYYLNNAGYPIGKAYALAKAIRRLGDYYAERVYTYHNYLGDPSAFLWNGTPHSFSEIILSRGDSSITVTGISEASTVVSLFSNDGKTYTQMTSASSVSFNHVSPNSTVMLYKQNCIPYIAPLVLQNTTLNKSQYVIASDVTAGKSVDSSRTSGQVTVTGDIDYEIEHTGEVRFEGGFRVDKGVRFSVRPSTYDN